MVGTFWPKHVDTNEQYHKFRPIFKGVDTYSKLNTVQREAPLSYIIVEYLKIEGVHTLLDSIVDCSD